MKKAAKIILAVIVGVILLDVFCIFYYNPTGYVDPDNGATDLIREPGAFTSRATEGIAWMSMDENGYNNANIPGEDGVFVLMMGSSHTEALNVMQEDNASVLLEGMLRDAGHEGCVYNIGMSSHTLVRNIANYPKALAEYRPTGYVIIETADVIMYTSGIYDALADELDPLPATGIDVPGLITDRPLMRTLYRQYMNLTGTEHVELYADYIPEDTMGRYEEALVTAFTQMRAEAEECGAELIIYYHPHLTLQADGSVLPATQQQCLEAFARACETSGVTFIDMTSIFMDTYARDGILPHGFNNTPAGTGHLNPDGHRLIAEELYRVICEKEAAE